MNYPTSFDLLIECRGCGLENLLTGFTATQPAVCNQCRERLLDLEMETTHQELVCEDCRMILLLSKDAPILAGRIRLPLRQHPVFAAKGPHPAAMGAKGPGGGTGGARRGGFRLVPAFRVGR